MEPQLAALVGLARELVARRVDVGMCDARPALMVGTALPGTRRYLFVRCAGKSFTWQDAEHGHPLGDPAGAAEKIAAYVRRSQPGGQDGQSGHR